MSPLEPCAAPDDELGAHVSAAGGVARAPARARAIGSRVLQLFTKEPRRWAERPVDEAQAASFRAEREAHGVRHAVAHDSYLINLASPDEALRAHSLACFTGELARCEALELEGLVTHPGNATDGDRPSGIARNAEALTGALEAVPGRVQVLLELTAGTGTSIGGSFQDLAAILARIPAALQERVGVCVDTCHAWVAGYDLSGDYDGVWRAFGDVVGLERLRLFHFNDAKDPRGSRRDRHQHIGEGTIGTEPFRRLLLDPRFSNCPKLLETPKGKDIVAADLRNLALLRRLRAEGEGLLLGVAGRPAGQPL